MLTPIEYENLRKLCNKLGISEDLIDTQLDYYENKRALFEYAGKKDPDYNSGLVDHYSSDPENLEQVKMEIKKLELEIKKLELELKKKELEKRESRTEIDFSPTAAFLHRGLIGYLIAKIKKDLEKEEDKIKGPWIII